jgi:hypothetical protein
MENTPVLSTRSKPRKKGASLKDDGDDDYQPTRKQPTSKKPKPPTKKQIKEQEKALQAERRLEMERQEQQRQADLSEQEEEQLAVLREANEARREREAPLIAQQKSLEKKMAWKDGQTVHLFDLPNEVSIHQQEKELGKVSNGLQAVCLVIPDTRNVLAGGPTGLLASILD